MEKFKCNHDWEIVKNFNFGRSWQTPSILECKKCKVCLTVNDASQLGLWKYTIGIQKWISISALIVSLGALIISIISIIK